jgi:hypothetical protein
MQAQFMSKITRDFEWEPHGTDGRAQHEIRYGMASVLFVVDTRTVHEKRDSTYILVRYDLMTDGSDWILWMDTYLYSVL